MIQITIDGLGGSGKSTVCRKLSEKIGVLYLDPNNVVNAISYKCVQKGINPTSERDVSKVLEDTTVEMIFRNTYTSVLLDGKEVTHMLNHRIVVQSFYALSKLKCVKEFISKLQEKTLKESSVIVEGLDVGDVDLSRIKYKFFLTADIEQRVQRKLQALREKNIYDISYEQMLNDTLESDNNYYIGEMSKVKFSQDMNMIDVSSKSVNEVLEEITSIIKGD